MFGHLKAEEFVNLLDGVAIPADRRRHVDACAQCASVWKSMESAHADFASVQASPPEPDWGEFRSSVRNQLLSRSVQRTSVIRRWTGWTIRPAMAWALSLLFAVGITTGGFLWHHETSHTDVSTTLPDSSVTAGAEAAELEAEISVWSQTSLFEELSQLETAEEEYLLEMLQSAQREAEQR